MDALALRGDEGRGTLRKAVGSCEQALIRGCPNGGTHLRQFVLSVRLVREVRADGRYELSGEGIEPLNT